MPTKSASYPAISSLSVTIALLLFATASPAGAQTLTSVQPVSAFHRHDGVGINLRADTNDDGPGNWSGAASGLNQDNTFILGAIENLGAKHVSSISDNSTIANSNEFANLYTPLSASPWNIKFWVGTNFCDADSVYTGLFSAPFTSATIEGVLMQNEPDDGNATVNCPNAPAGTGQLQKTYAGDNNSGQNLNNGWAQWIYQRGPQIWNLIRAQSSSMEVIGPSVLGAYNFGSAAYQYSGYWNSSIATESPCTSTGSNTCAGAGDMTGYYSGGPGRFANSFTTHAYYSGNPINPSRGGYNPHLNCPGSAAFGAYPCYVHFSDQDTTYNSTSNPEKVVFSDPNGGHLYRGEEGWEDGWSSTAESLTSATETGNGTTGTFTYTSSGANRFPYGLPVTISGFTSTAFNISGAVTAVTSGTFTVTASTTLTSATATGTGSAYCSGCLTDGVIAKYIVREMEGDALQGFTRSYFFQLCPGASGFGATSLLSNCRYYTNIAQSKYSGVAESYLPQWYALQSYLNLMNDPGDPGGTFAPSAISLALTCSPACAVPMSGQPADTTNYVYSDVVERSDGTILLGAVLEQDTQDTTLPGSSLPNEAPKDITPVTVTWTLPGSVNPNKSNPQLITFIADSNYGTTGHLVSTPIQFTSVSGNWNYVESITDAWSYISYNSPWYYIQNYSSDCMTASATVPVAGDELEQTTSCGTEDFWKEWQFNPDLDNAGYYQVTNRASYANASPSAPVVWDVTGHSLSESAKMVLETPDSTYATTTQSWMPVASTNYSGYDEFVVKSNGMCLDVPGNANTNFLQLQQYDCNNTSAQAWKLIKQPF